MRYIVDTNVAIVANGQKTNASPECRLSAIDFLERMITKGRIVLDIDGDIQAEYQKSLSAGQPGVGHRFFQSMLTTASSRIERFELKKNRDGSYSDFPSSGSLKNFDMSDRKFAALAVVSKAPVANAVDTDWLLHKNDLSKAGVKVEFLCSEASKRWFVE